MISYVTVGADDMVRARRFYDAFLPILGYGVVEGPEGLSYALPAVTGQPVALPEFYVKPPFDGAPASAGNGTMIALAVDSKEKVHQVYDKAMALGAQDEGPPGARMENFYAAYFRDLDGNKLNVFKADF